MQGSQRLTSDEGPETHAHRTSHPYCIESSLSGSFRDLMAGGLTPCQLMHLHHCKLVHTDSECSADLFQSLQSFCHRQTTFSHIYGAFTRVLFWTVRPFMQSWQSPYSTVGCTRDGPAGTVHPRHALKHKSYEQWPLLILALQQERSLFGFQAQWLHSMALC